MAFRLTASPVELATLISAARCVVEGRQGELTEEARSQLRQVLASYEAQMARLLDRDPAE